MAIFTITTPGKSIHYKTLKGKHDFIKHKGRDQTGRNIEVEKPELGKKPRDHRKIRRKPPPQKKAAAQEESEDAEAQAKNENAAAEAKSENTEAEAEEVERTCTGTRMNDSVETTGEAGGRHPGLHTVNEEAGRIEHDMRDDTGERTKTMQEHHTRCSHSDEEAGSIVLRTRKKTMKKQARQQQTEEKSKEDVEIQRLIEERRSTPKEEKQRLKEVSKCIKNVSETKKE